MKKIYVLFLVLFLSVKVYSQVSNYTFSQSNGTYQEITGGTVLATATAADYSSSFDNVVWNLPSGTIPFSFKFNDVSYTGLNVNSNGYITFGATTSSTSSYTPISSTTAYEGAISAWGRDINGAFHSSIVSDVSWKVEGASPNREFVIQYKNVRPSPSTSTTAIYAMNFQIRLLENGNVIKFIYGSHGFVLGTTNATGTPQIGLRGLTNSDYLNRSNSTSVNFTSSVAGTSNSSTQAYNTATGAPGMPTNGLIYTFTPPPICTGMPNGGTVSSATQVGCSPTAVSVPFANSGFSGFVYQWQESDDNGVLDPWSDVTGATTLSYTPPPINGSTNKYYRLKTTCSSSGQVAYSTVHTVTIPPAPNAATGMTFTNVTDNAVTVNWTNGNGDRRVLLVNTTNNFSSLPVSGAAYANGTVLSGGDILVWDGTAANTTISGLKCNTTYYFRLYEYKRCGSSPNYAFFPAAHISGNITTSAFTPTIVPMPATTNFTGFTGANLSTVFPGWEERVGDGPIAAAAGASAWTSSSALSVPTAKVNLYTNTRNEWIISPIVNITSISRVRFKAAITNFASGAVDPDRMIGTDDKVQVMISSDACGGGPWVSLYTFDASTTVNLTNVLTEYEVVIPSQYINQNIRIGFKATDGPIDDAPDYDFHITDVFVENIPPPSLTVSKTDILCHGGTGSATITVTGGLAPFTYSWSPSGGTAATATGLAAGIYTVTVTDAANRTATANVTIDEPDALVSNMASTSITCNGAN
ncbi:SprB repeat-containing protein, partial [Paenimyroides ummariense]